MQSTTTPLARGVSSRIAVPWRSLGEVALVAAVIALLLPAFAQLRASEDGRTHRFRSDALVVQGLPDPVLPALCRDYAAAAEQQVAARLCDRASPAKVPGDLDRMPRILQAANVRIAQALTAPLAVAEADIAALRSQQREGQADVLASDDAIGAIVDRMRPYATRFGLDEGAAAPPRALACAYALVERTLAEGAGRDDRRIARANAVLLLGAALDGHPATEGLASSAALPATRVVPPRCGATETAETLRATAALVTDARDAAATRVKDDRMRTLLRTAGEQWAAWSLAGLVLVALARVGLAPMAGAGLTLVTFAFTAWLFRVPFPFSSEHALVLGRVFADWSEPPARFVVAMLAAGVALLVGAAFVRSRNARRPWRLSSALAYPGVVLATGIGWLVLLDLSANGHYGNRYLALYHQGHLWLAMTVLCVAAFLREPLGRGLAWALAVADGLAARVVRGVGPLAGGAALALVLLVAAIVLSVVMANMRQLTSELGRLWLIVGAAWFFFLRGTPLTERLARSGNSAGSLLRYVAPLLVVVGVLVSAMLMTRDMGPLLIAGYGAGAFVAASVAAWSHARNGGTIRAYGAAAILFAVWIAVTTAALFKVGALDEVAAGRLENAIAPLASVNDHLALVTWFQKAAPPHGFGPGAVPWCGFGAGQSCPGVPAQIQSDYTFTALVGEFGWLGAWTITLGAVVWLFAIIRRHAAATRGEPRLVRAGSRMVNDDQAFVSWMCVAWVAMTLCQLGVTVAGNLAVIPLTGVTFPFVSFGMTSLVINMAMLGLALNVRDVPRD